MEVLDPEREHTALTKLGTVEIASSRASQEVQAALVIAKRFPRDVNAAFTRILQGCRRKALAEQASYAYPRGGTRVSGPSIRLAEHLAQNWGNFESGVVELERREGESTAMAYSWDLETNARDVKVFTVEHVRERGESKGGNVQLTDPRDVYELVANMGARRKRACILALIPGDVVDAAEEECVKTLKGDTSEPLPDRIRKMAATFAEVGVTIPMLEKRLGHNLDATDETELVGLRKIFTGMKDGMSKREDWFSLDPTDQPTGKASFGLKGKGADKKTEAHGPPPTPQPEPPKAPVPPPGPEEQAQIREQEHAEEEAAKAPPTQAAVDPPKAQAQRADLLTQIDEMTVARKMSMASRAGLWRQYCGTETRETATGEHLEALAGHLRRMSGTLL